MNKSLLVLKIILVCLAFTPSAITYYPKVKVYMESKEEIGCYPEVPLIQMSQPYYIPSSNIGRTYVNYSSDPKDNHSFTVGYKAERIIHGSQNVAIGESGIIKEE